MSETGGRQERNYEGGMARFAGKIRGVSHMCVSAAWGGTTGEG